MPLLLTAGCASLPPIVPSAAVDSRWIVTVDGDLGAAVRALKQSIVAHGGNPIDQDDPVQGTFVFDSGPLSLSIEKDRIMISVAFVAVGANAPSESKERGAALVGDIVSAAAQDLHQALHLNPVQSVPDNRSSVQNGPGVTTANPTWKVYGTYLQNVVNAVQKRWDNLLDQSNVYPPAGSFVVVGFVLAPDGTIARITNVANHSSRLGEQRVLDALSESAPFGVWSEDMKAHLNAGGEELVFTFYYQ